MRAKHCWALLCVSALLLASGRAQETVNVRLVFQGVSQSAFDSIASKVTDTVAAVAGVPAEYVALAGSSIAASSSTNAAPAAAAATPAPASTVKAVPESAQLPSAMATAPGYIRAQYYASIGVSATGSSTDSGADSAVPKTIYTPFTASTAPSKKKHTHKPTTTASGSNTSGNSSSSSSSSSESTSGNTVVVQHSDAAAGSNRKLLAVDSTTVEYNIKANASAGPWADAVVIRRKIMASAAGFGQASSAGFGKGFYATLEKNGVSYQPIIFLDGKQILAGGLTLDAPKSKFGTRHEDEPKVFDPTALANNNKTGVAELRDVRPVESQQQPGPQQQGLAPWIIGVIVAAAVLALAFGGVIAWKCCGKCCPKDKTADDASQGSSQNQFITDDGSGEV